MGRATATLAVVMATMLSSPALAIRVNLTGFTHEPPIDVQAIGPGLVYSGAAGEYSASLLDESGALAAPASVANDVATSFPSRASHWTSVSSEAASTFSLPRAR